MCGTDWVDEFYNPAHQATHHILRELALPGVDDGALAAAAGAAAAAAAGAGNKRQAATTHQVDYHTVASRCRLNVSLNQFVELTSEVFICLGWPLLCSKALA